MPLSPAITARNFMTAKFVSLAPDSDIMDAMRLFLMHRISGAPVIDQRGELVGMLTERDCLKAVVAAGYHGEGSGGALSAFMTADVVSVDATASLLDVAQMFVTSIYRRFPVLDEGQVVGVISRRDVIRAVLDLA